MASPWEAGALLAHEEAEGGQGDPWQAEEGDPEEGGVLSSSAEAAKAEAEEVVEEEEAPHC